MPLLNIGDDQLTKNVTFILDCTLCPIEQRENATLEEITFSGRKLKHCYNYQVVTEPRNGKYVNWYGPVPGTFNDLQVLTLSRLADQVEDWEVGLADGIYSENKEPLTLLTPFSSTEGGKSLQQRVWNNLVNSVRCGVECALGRLKRLKVLCEPPHLRSPLSHQHFFFIGLNITNIDIDLHPLRLSGPPATMRNCPLAPVRELDNTTLLTYRPARTQWKHEVRSPYLHLLQRRTKKRQ